MTFPIVIETVDDQIVASLAGVPDVRVSGPSRPDVLKSLQGELARRIPLGALDALDVQPSGGVLNLAGKYADDSTLVEICEQAYADRNRDRDSE